MSLFTELKRRKVFRAAVVYCATAFMLLQVADLLGTGLGLPDWFFPMVTVLTILGLPIALVLAWALELTPDGLKVTQARDAQALEEASPAVLGKRTVFMAGLFVVLGVGIGAGWFLRPGAGSDPSRSGETVTVASPSWGTPLEMDKSLAVLPFADFSPGADQQWFADGLAEEILNALARTPDLKVASRTAAFALRDSGKSPSQIGAELHVAHILEGSIRRANDQIRVTTQLVRVTDGHHLWSQRFDGSMEDAIAIQEQIAFEIARALKTAMDPEALADMLAAGTRSVEAWEHWLKSQALHEDAIDRLDDSQLDEVLAAAERAVELDPTFSQGHALLASFWLQQIMPVAAFYGAMNLPPAEMRARFERHMEAAIRHASSETERLGYQAELAWVRVQQSERLALLRQAVALQPEQADAYLSLGEALIEASRFDEAREMLLKAADLGRGTSVELVDVFELLHRVDPEAALPLIERALAEDGDSLLVLYLSHRALLHAGQVEAAADLARAFVLRDPDSDSSQVVQLRQACAEGRDEDAEAHYRRVSDPTWKWLLLKTLGRDEGARELLRPLDTPDRLFALSNYLTYTFFDPGDYPLLTDTLMRQNAFRPQPRPLRFACKAAHHSPTTSYKEPAP